MDGGCQVRRCNIGHAHGCIPGGIVAAMSEKLSAVYGKPWVNLIYDGFLETTNLAKINNIAEALRFCPKGNSEGL